MTSTISFEDVDVVFGIQFDFTNHMHAHFGGHRVSCPCPTPDELRTTRVLSLATHATSALFLGQLFHQTPVGACAVE